MSEMHPTSESEIRTLTQAIPSVTSKSAGTIEIRDIYALEQALPPRFRPRAYFLAHTAIYDVLRGLDQAGAPSWPNFFDVRTERLENELESRLMGYPCFTVAAMSSTHASGDIVLIMGDFGGYYRSGGLWEPDAKIQQSVDAMGLGPFDASKAFRMLVVQ
jgi:HK97 family phage major capsid protein